MKPYFEDNLIKIYNGDARDMGELPDNSVQMVCTSPPYWGLRKYSGLPDLIWGGRDCEHKWGELKKTIKHHSGETNPGLEAHFKDAGANDDLGSCLCSLCGAWKGQLGLEPTPELYLSHLVEICREIRRVMRKDAVFFLNIGDSYAGSGCGTNDYRTQASRSINKSDIMFTKTPPQQKAKAIGLKPKDLCLIPFRLAIRLQEDGWWVRSVIVWSKPNPMPESVTDRPTESHEYILMLTKSAHYYWDAEAVREAYQPATLERREYPDRGAKRYGEDRLCAGTGGSFRKLAESGLPQKDVIGFNPSGRNLRSVWEFPTHGYPKAHFATFPEALPMRCIKAATPEVGCCSKCGAPWERVTEVVGKRITEAMKVAGCDSQGGYSGTEQKDYPLVGAQKPSETKARILESMSQVKKTVDWQPTCSCNADKVPSIVLDPFAGSGTTLWVAKKLGRRSGVRMGSGGVESATHDQNNPLNRLTMCKHWCKI